MKGIIHAAPNHAEQLGCFQWRTDIENQMTKLRKIYEKL